MRFVTLFVLPVLFSTGVFAQGAQLAQQANDAADFLNDLPTTASAKELKIGLGKRCPSCLQAVKAYEEVCKTSNAADLKRFVEDDPLFVRMLAYGDTESEMDQARAEIKCRKAVAKKSK